MEHDCNFVGVGHCIGVGNCIGVGAVGNAVAGELGRLVRGLGQPQNDYCCYRSRSWGHCNVGHIGHHRIDR